MGELRVRAMVGEGRSARKGLLRFVLENEGHIVVSEAASTLELAQQLVVHRPDLVVLDDGIDASAVGMIREVLPSARVILVWPKGVSAIGADARLEPSEVMAGLGPAVERVMGSGPSIRPKRPRVPVPDVIVVPEAEPLPPAETTTLPFPQEPPAEVTSEATGPAAERAALATVFPATEAEVEEPIVVVPEALSGVMLRPPTDAPSWVFTAPEQGTSAPERRRRWWLGVALVLLGVALGAAVGAVILADRTVSIRGIVGSVGDLVLPTPGGGGQTGGTTDQPGTYEGRVQVQADGTIRLSSEGDLRLRVDGFVHLVADGVVKVNGEGVVQSVSNEHVRVHGNGTVRLTVTGGHLRMRLQGSLVARGVGTVHIDGIGRFLIRHRPL